MPRLLKWEFNGDVSSFGRIIYRGWKARTVAVSQRKAYSNLCHQYKQQNNMSENTKISLDGEIKEIFI